MFAVATLHTENVDFIGVVKHMVYSCSAALAAEVEREMAAWTFELRNMARSQRAQSMVIDLVLVCEWPSLYYLLQTLVYFRE